jgi:phosphoglycerate dehydrogenase-like enzyme
MGEAKNNLLILSTDAEEYLKIIRRHNLSDILIYASKDAAGADDLCRHCNIIFGDPDLIEPLLHRATALRWIQSSWAGVEPLLGAHNRSDYLLTGVKGVFGPIMTEYVLCHMLVHTKKVLQRYESQKIRQWNDMRPGTLRGQTMGIMGVGSIGARIAEAAKHFGMITSGYTRKASGCKAIDSYFHGDQITDFVAPLDFLVCVLPDTPSTNHMISNSIFEAMKKSAILINVGRGNSIDETSLEKALWDGEIAGAVLDVFKEEPLPPEHPLWRAPNITITSHTAGPTFPEDVAPVFINNYLKFIARKPLDHLIDFQRQY